MPADNAEPKTEDRESKSDDRVPNNPQSEIGAPAPVGHPKSEKGPKDCECESPSAFYKSEDELETALAKDPHVKKARAALQKKSAIPNPKSEIK